MWQRIKLNVITNLATQSETYCENCRFLIREEKYGVGNTVTKFHHCLLFQRNVGDSTKRCGECLKAQCDTFYRR